MPAALYVRVFDTIVSNGPVA